MNFKHPIQSLMRCGLMAEDLLDKFCDKGGIGLMGTVCIIIALLAMASVVSKAVFGGGVSVPVRIIEPAR